MKGKFLQAKHANNKVNMIVESQKEYLGHQWIINDQLHFLNRQRWKLKTGDSFQTLMAFLLRSVMYPMSCVADTTINIFICRCDTTQIC